MHGQVLTTGNLPEDPPIVDGLKTVLIKKNDYRKGLVPKQVSCHCLDTSIDPCTFVWATYQWTKRSAKSGQQQATETRQAEQHSNPVQQVKQSQAVQHARQAHTAHATGHPLSAEQSLSTGQSPSAQQLMQPQQAKQPQPTRQPQHAKQVQTPVQAQQQLKANAPAAGDIWLPVEGRYWCPDPTCLKSYFQNRFKRYGSVTSVKYAATLLCGSRSVFLSSEQELAVKWHAVVDIW